MTRGTVHQDDSQASKWGPPPDGAGDDDPWTSAASAPFAVASLAAKRARRTWRLLLPVGLGVLIAVTLLCAVPLYSAQIATALLHQELTLGARPDGSASVASASASAIGQSSHSASAINVDAILNTTFITPGSADSLDRETAQLVQATFGSFIRSSTIYYETGDTLTLASVNGADFSRLNPAVPVGLARPLAYDYTQAAPHMRLLEGRLPQDQPPGDPAEVLATEQSSLHTGDLITLLDRMTGRTQVQLRVAGVWRPANPNDPFWNDRSFVSLLDYGRDPAPPPVFPLLLTRSGFFTSLATVLAMTGVRLHHVFFPAPDRFTAQSASVALDGLTTFRTRFGAIVGQSAHASTTIVTNLDNILRAIQRQLDLLAQPLYIVVAQIAGLLLLFVAAMTAMLLDLEGGDLATLRSRGASVVQIVSSLAMMSLPVAAAAMGAGLLCAPLLALVVMHLFLSGVAVDVPALLRPDTLTAMLPPAVVALALCLVVMVATAWLAARQEISAFRREQGRAARIPLWRRYYLDVLLVALCVAGYLELVPFGSVDVRSQLDPRGIGPDPLLLVTPGLILLAGGLVTLRLLPLGARAGTWLAARGRGAPVLLAFAQVARATRQFSRLALLLTLAVGLAAFAVTFNASLDRNAADRAAYVAGGDLRLDFDNLSRGYYTFRRENDLLSRLPGVVDVTSIYRTLGVAPPGEEAAGAAILGVEPDSLGAIAAWRADFASQPLDTLLRQLDAHRAVGGIPGSAARPIWALVSTRFAQTLHLQQGQRFALTPQENSSATLYFTAGAFLDNFPTASDPPGAFLIVDQDDLVNALRDPATVNVTIGAPNDYWLRTTNLPADNAARAAVLNSPGVAEQLGTPSLIVDRRVLAAALRSGPLVSGLRGLLLSGVAIAALLAIVGSVLQSLATIRQRRLQLAVLRTLGTTRGQLTRLLLIEQTAIYCLGLLAGGALGPLVSTAALPFLEFTSSVAGGDVSSAALPYTLVFDPLGLLLFFGLLFAGFLVALLVPAMVSARSGLGNALRIGED